VSGKSHCRKWAKLTAASEGWAVYHRILDPFAHPNTGVGHLWATKERLRSPPPAPRPGPTRSGRVSSARRMDRFLSAALGMCRLEATRHRGYMGMEHDGKWRCFTIEIVI
jgi:hypothetical protein